MALCMQKTNAKGRCTQFGLEVPENVTWNNWEPGKEYTKNIPIKNVHFGTQRIHYTVPTLHVFSSKYPKPISLSSGTSHIIAVSFKPVERGVYSDKIVVQTQEGDVEIPIKATLPVPRIELVESVQFGMIAITDTNSVFFKIRNSSDVSLCFNFDVPLPFTISPNHGNLSPRKECQLTCTFTPTTASVYSADAVCFYEDCKRKIELLGTGKFAYIEVESADGEITREIDFRNVAMGQSATQIIILSNKSPVTAPFKVRPLWGQKGPISPFSCSDLVGRISAFEKHKLKISFTPNTLSGFFIDYLSIECVGSLTETTVKCVATARQPDVSLSTDCIEFSSVQCESLSRRVIEMHNRSPVPTLFQFMNVEQTVFSVEPYSGRISAGSKQTLTVSFRPTDPLPYYRRLVCLVHYQEPLFVDVLGAGTTDAINPVLLREEHLLIYEQRWLKGLASYPPDQLKLWTREGHISIHGTEIHISPNAPFLQETIDFQQTPVDKSSYEYIFTPNDMSQFILDNREIDFGFVTPSADHSTHTILATNLSKGVINCVWTVPKGSKDIFLVSPRTHELAPGSSFEFRVLFSPSLPDKYFDTTIECYGYFKALKDYHLVEKEFVSPSWCNTVKLSGHTWKIGENSPSTLIWDSKEIQFSPSLPNSFSYKTFSLSNKSSVPIQFNFRPFETDCFEILPKLGLLSQENQIFIVQMKSPPLTELATKLPSLVSTTLTCNINHDLKHPERLLLCGTIESPRVLFPDGDSLFFHPCVIDGRVDQGLRVQNISMLALKFDWSTQEGGPGITRVIPQKGTIRPNEIQTHKWVFTPKAEGRHSFRATITTSFAHWNSDQRHRESISIIGDCCTSELFVTNRQVDLGNITVRSIQKEYVTLVNPCACHLTYSLSYKAVYSGLNGEIELCGAREVQLPTEECSITAGSRHSIALFLKPEHQGVYSVEVSYRIITERKQAIATQSLFTVRANVCYPSISVVDTKLCSGNVSKNRIWEMLNIDTLNSLLRMEPSYDEMRYDIATRHSMKRKIPVLTRAIVDFNFGSAPIESPESEVILLLENPTSVSVEYAFQFPNDMYLEPEYWADTGELDQFEAKELYLMENSIFSVDRKFGSLLPGERRSVKCSHKHRLAGESILPVLLKIRRGREVLLNFKGITSQLLTPHVNFTSDTFHFRPIPVGLLLPPLQAYKLYNGGDTGSSYELDTSPLFELIQQTNGLQVLDCLNPTGHIPAYGYTELLFLFTPPEPVQYTVDLPLKFDGDTKLITFVAEGYTMDEASRSNSVLLPSKQEIAEVPTKQLIHSETEIAILSSNTISFKHLPLFSPARQITFLRNNSNRTLSFVWEMPSHRISEVLTIKPQNGFLHPNQSISCQVIFLSMVDPSFYDVTIRCVITDESSVLIYKQDLAEWEKEQNEKQHIFTISGQREIKSQKKDSTIVKRHNSLPPLEQESYEDWLRKDLSKKSKHRPRKPKEIDLPKPIFPSPFSLELCLSARTHSIADYYTIFPDCTAPFIDTNEIISAMQPSNLDIPINQSVSSLLTSMLSSLIHSLIHDTSFSGCMSTIDKEPIPYFTQFQPRRKELTDRFESIESTQEEHLLEPPKPSRAESAPTRLSASRQSEKLIIPSSAQLDTLKRQDNINILLEAILENSIRCIICEAATNEIDITAKSHRIPAQYNTP